MIFLVIEARLDECLQGKEEFYQQYGTDRHK